MELKEFTRLLEVIDKLRDPENGCPWDLKQTHQSLLKYLIEESYEFIQATENNDPQQMQDELGDVLLQVLLHAKIGSEDKKFDIESISKNLADKMIRRHPHVFSDTKAQSAEEVSENWEKIKQSEKKGKEEFLINSKVLNAPGLTSSFNIGKETEDLNFDWEDPNQVSYKVEEEWQELKEEITAWPRINIERVEEELGDFLFSCAQLARHLNLDPEETIRKANKKFIRRFNSMETIIKNEGIEFKSLNQSDLDYYWTQAKSNEKK